MRETSRARLVAYGVAVLATGLSLGIRLALVPWLDFHAELMTFFPAIILSAYLGGLGPGLVATFLGAAAGRYFFIEPRSSFAIDSLGGAYGLGLFVLAGGVISGLMESLHRSRRRIEASNEQRWRSLTEALPQLVWSALPDGACDYFSTQWTEHTGIPEAELLGWRWLQTLHPEDRQRTRQFWQESVAGRHPYDVEYRVRRHDGEYRWFKTRGVPIRDSSGTIVKWFGTCTDITDLRKTEEALRASERRFRGTFENAAVGITHTNLDGRWLRVNEKLCAILGYPVEEALRLRWQDVTCPEDLPASTDQLTALLRGERRSYSMEKRYVRKDGSVIWGQLDVSLQRNAAGQPAFAIAVIQDITERKGLEGDLRQAKEAAEAANRAKDEFLANVSHEIRTPMNAILGMTELTLDTPLTGDQRQCLQTVKSAGDNLLGIINDLLDFAKIEAGKLELDPTDFGLRAAVGDTLRALGARAHNRGLELTYNVQPDLPDALIGDAGRLRQVLLNLVGNAIKFTGHGEVVVQVRKAPTDNTEHTDTKGEGNFGQGEVAGRTASPQADGSLSSSSVSFVSSVVGLSFSVRDTGIGIARDQQERIFRAFEQEDTSTTRKYGGTGLGLTIASRLVALMGGQITVDSEPGRGSTFTFTARFGQQAHPAGSGDPGRAAVTSAESAEPRRAPYTESLSGPLQVLVAEDNEFNAQLLEQLLGRRGHRAGLAANGREALRLTEERRFDLLLLDMHMPEMDGFQVARAVRERERTTGGHLPIIALTARSRPEDRARCLAAGMDDFLAKPVQAVDLWAAMDRVGAMRGPRSLLDPRVLLAACGGDAAILAKIGQTFRARLPDHVKAVRDALDNRDAPRLREAAHKLAGMVAAFSTVAGGVASELEDQAAQGHLDEARPLAAQLETMAEELLRLVDGLSLDTLLRRAKQDRDG
jgi:PAS domain S-box-containing protein